MLMLRIGIDFGGVIVPNQTDNNKHENPFFDFTGDQFLIVRECKDARRVLERLAKQGHQLHIVSKAGTKIQKRTLQWLSKNVSLSAQFSSRQRYIFVKSEPKKEISVKSKKSHF